MNIETIVEINKTFSVANDWMAAQNFEKYMDFVGSYTQGKELKLKDNAVYQECVNRIVERTTAILIAEASLAYQRDIFRSYLAIAGMVNK